VAQLTTEWIKQNYNHPSIVLWSVGNEAAAAPADQSVPIVKALDPSRPVVVANMKSTLADFKVQNTYPGWYGAHMRDFQPKGFYSEIGAGGVVTTHCDYNQCDWRVNSYEPEEYQQLVLENHFQRAFRGDDSQLGLFCIWTLRDFSDSKYKAPVGINSKGLLTYAGDKKDVYYLYRCFLRPDTPTLWITSKRYFVRKGAVDNGIKVYSNAARVTLTLNGEKVSTLDNGLYTIPDGPWSLHGSKPKKGATAGTASPKINAYEPEKVDNVFYWPVSLHTGKNVVTASDGNGHTDTATVYFYGDNGLPALPNVASPIGDLASSNANNPAYYMDMPVHAQWPLYYDLDSTADNSWNTIPPEIENATWIALRRVTKPDQSTSLSFTMTRAAKIYVMATKADTPPAFAAKGQFKEVSATTYLWRNNALLLVPAQLYVRNAVVGEKISLDLGDRDVVVAIK
jgi:beta-galactosidase